MSVEEVEQLRCKTVKTLYKGLAIYLLFMFLLIFVLKIRMFYLLAFPGVFGLIAVLIFADVKYKKFAKEYKNENNKY